MVLEDQIGMKVLHERSNVGSVHAVSKTYASFSKIRARFDIENETMCTVIDFFNANWSS